MKNRTIVASLFLIFSAYGAHGQYSEFKYSKKNHSSEDGYEDATKLTRYFTVGAGPALYTYLGDVTPQEKFVSNAMKVIRPGFSAFVNYKWKSPFTFTGNLFYGRIIGDDFNNSPGDGGNTRKYVRNLSFRNDLFGASFHGNFMILPDRVEFFKRLKFNIYLNAGLALYYSNPKAKTPEDPDTGEEGVWVALRPLGTEGQNNPATGRSKYSPIQVGIPLGLGMRFRLGYRTDLHLDASLTYLLSDYVDDIGEKYVDLGALDSGLARAMSDRSREQKASIQNEERDWQFINDNTTITSYVSVFDGNTYTVFEGFGQDGATRGGARHDYIGAVSFRISYIISN